MAYHQNIPKIIHQIWLGPHPRPTAWMKSWKKAHPDWDYRLWTDANIPKLQNQKQFDEINSYAGKADILRYELLFNYGGVYIDADNECLRPLDDYLLRYHFFAGYENEIERPGLIANGVMGSRPKHPLLGNLINAIHRIKKINKDKAWIVVGPLLLTNVIRQYAVIHGPVKILPSHNFLPEHFTGTHYTGAGKVYGREYWHTTHIDLKFTGFFDK